MQRLARLEDEEASDRKLYIIVAEEFERKQIRRDLERRLSFDVAKKMVMVDAARTLHRDELIDEYVSSHAKASSPQLKDASRSPLGVGKGTTTSSSRVPRSKQGLTQASLLAQMEMAAASPSRPPAHLGFTPKSTTRSIGGVHGALGYSPSTQPSLGGGSTQRSVGALSRVTSTSPSLRSDLTSIPRSALVVSEADKMDLAEEVRLKAVIALQQRKFLEGDQRTHDEESQGRIISDWTNYSPSRLVAEAEASHSSPGSEVRRRHHPFDLKHRGAQDDHGVPRSSSPLPHQTSVGIDAASFSDDSDLYRDNLDDANGSEVGNRSDDVDRMLDAPVEGGSVVDSAEGANEDDDEHRGTLIRQPDDDEVDGENDVTPFDRERHWTNSRRHHPDAQQDDDPEGIVMSLKLAFKAKGKMKERAGLEQLKQRRKERSSQH